MKLKVIFFISSSAIGPSTEVAKTHSSYPASRGVSSDGEKVQEDMLNAYAPEFVPIRACSGDKPTVPSMADVTRGPVKVLEAEPLEAQWSQVISKNIGNNYMADFPSLDNNGARPKTYPPVQQREGKKGERKSKKESKISGKSSSNVETEESLSNGRKDSFVPPGLSIESSLMRKLPPGINVNANPVVSPTASSGSPGISKPTGKEANSEGTGMRIESNGIGGNAQQRNASLVSLIRKLISADDFEKFRDLSGSFRRSEMDSTSYYRFIREIFRNNLNLVFDELVDLLPDKGKQKQLKKIHISLMMFPVLTWGETKVEADQPVSVSATELKSAWNGSGTHLSLLRNDVGCAVAQKPIVACHNVTPQVSPIWKKKDKDLQVCNICGIAVSKKSMDSHMLIHAEGDFPALSAVEQTPKCSWNKRKPQFPVHNAWGKSS